MTSSFRFGFSWLTLSFCLLGLNTTLQAASDQFCQRYARDIAFTFPKDSPDLSKQCRDDERWSIGKSPIDPRKNIEKDANYQWCLGESEKAVNQKRYQHNQDVNTCNNEYKTIVLNSGRVTTPAVNDTDMIKMEPAPESVHETVGSKQTANPYSRLFSSVSKSIRAGGLEGCKLLSLPLDIDDNQETQEWIVAAGSQCFDSSRITSHVWILQESDTGQRVLFEGEDTVIALRNSEHNGYKDLYLTTALDPAINQAGLCGGIAAEWHYVDGRYLPFDAKPVVSDECINYVLPDYLQGANTYTMKSGEWEKAMELEEQRRQELLAPTEKKLADYIPEWMSHIREMTSDSSKAEVIKPRKASAPRNVKPVQKEQILGIDIDDLQSILNTP